MSRSIAYYAGAIAGMGFVVILCVVVYLFAKKFHKPIKYDERQQLARGKAYKYGFFTLIGYMCLYGIADELLPYKWCTPFTGTFIGILLSLVVFGVISIMHDAYVSIYEKPRRSAAMLIAVAAWNLMIGFINSSSNNRIIENGMITTYIVNYLCALALMIIVVSMLIKMHIGSSRDEDETE